MEIQRAAGALITTTMVSRDKPDIMEDLRRHLENHDSNTAFKMLGFQIMTGKTLTNVNDLNVICRLTNGNSD